MLGGPDALSQAGTCVLVPKPTAQRRHMPCLGSEFTVSRASHLESRSPKERATAKTNPNLGRNLGRTFLLRVPGERKFKRMGLQDKQGPSVDVLPPTHPVLFSKCALDTCHVPGTMLVSGAGEVTLLSHSLEGRRQGCRQWQLDR